mgnify:CR=1 FL=1
MDMEREWALSLHGGNLYPWISMKVVSFPHWETCAHRYIAINGGNNVYEY